MTESWCRIRRTEDNTPRIENDNIVRRHNSYKNDEESAAITRTNVRKSHYGSRFFDSRKRLNSIALLLLILIPKLEAARPPSSLLIKCFECSMEDQETSCNKNSCDGVTCFKHEITSIEKNVKSVRKGCSDQEQPTGCRQTSMGSKLVWECTCNTNYCNGDQQLIAAGIQHQLFFDGGVVPTTFRITTIFLCTLLCFFFGLFPC